MTVLPQLFITIFSFYIDEKQLLEINLAVAVLF